MPDRKTVRLDWGMAVISSEDLFNDGSYPDLAPDAIIVARGTRGQNGNIGTHTESRSSVFLVEFDGGKVVGCLEWEILPVT